LSHKSFLGKVLGDRPVHERQAATIAGGCLALAAGAAIIRVHDVAAAVDTVRVLEAVRRGTIP
jgi:dihydropteroate synthase